MKTKKLRKATSLNLEEKSNKKKVIWTVKSLTNLSEDKGEFLRKNI